MNHHTKALLITVIVLALGWTLLLTLFTGSVAEELKLLRREKMSDSLYLRCRIRELESTLHATLLPKPGGSDTPVGGDPESEEVTDQDGDPTEEITLPTHDSPETVPPADEPRPAAQYILAEHEGILGVFDAAGELLRTVNVYVMTLPLADREALAVGIPAYSEEEMDVLVSQYE